MSSVLYDAPGPVSLRRQRIGSIVGAVVLVGLVAASLVYAAAQGLLGADRWDVLYDPPRNQEAADVWSSLVIRGLGATLRAAVVAAPIALALGFLLAVWRTARSRVARTPAVVVVEVFRGLPVLLMMFFALLAFGLSAFQSVVFGLVVYNMAVFAEILRAGLASLPKGQAEAAYAIGLSRGQTLFTILLPQAVRTMMPSLVAQLVVLLKDSALGFIVGYAELLRSIQLNTAFFGERYSLALFVVGASVYLVVNMALSSLARRLNRRSDRPSAVDDTALDEAQVAQNTPGNMPRP
ncbi:MAG: amino acid ABC transporter permease [Actinotalea sp.]|nr:amino acid ABC transporter permease [Actinotalea sp.]